MERRDRRAQPNRLAVAGNVEPERAARPVGPEACRKTSPTGFSAVPPPGPATPVTATAMSAPSRARAPLAIAAAVSAETAPCVASTSSRHAELLRLDVVRVRDDRRRGRRRSRPAVGEPRGDEAARARLRGREREALARAAARARARRSSARRARRDSARRPRRGAPRARRRAAPRPAATNRSTWISKSRAQIVTSTPPPSPPAAASDCATADSETP